jgi:hypothetical protein
LEREISVSSANQLRAAARHHVEQLDGLCHVIEQAQAEHHVVAPLDRVPEEIALLEAIARAVQALGFKDEVGLLDVHLAGVDAQDEVGVRLGREQRPVAGVAAQIEHSAAAQRAPGERQQRLEYVASPLLVAVGHSRIGGRVAMPCSNSKR